MRRFIVTPETYTPGQGQIFTLPSTAVPDMSMSIRQILDRHSRGLPTTGQAKPASYGSETDDGVDLSTLDHAEREDYIAARINELNSLKTRIKESQKQHYKKTRKEDDERSQKDDKRDTLAAIKDLLSDDPGTNIT